MLLCQKNMCLLNENVCWQARALSPSNITDGRSKILQCIAPISGRTTPDTAWQLSFNDRTVHKKALLAILTRLTAWSIVGQEHRFPWIGELVWQHLIDQLGKEKERSGGQGL